MIQKSSMYVAEQWTLDAPGSSRWSQEFHPRCHKPIFQHFLHATPSYVLIPRSSSKKKRVLKSVSPNTSKGGQQRLRKNCQDKRVKRQRKKN